MARRRPPAQVSGKIPDALRDKLDPLWKDTAAFLRLCASTGVDPAGAGHVDLTKAPWWARFDAYRRAWSLANGYEHPQWPLTIDYQRAKAAGMDMHSTSRYRLVANYTKQGANDD